MEGDLVYSKYRRFPKMRRWSIEANTVYIHGLVFKGITYMYGVRPVSDITKELKFNNYGK
jgi:hypothetical protein